MPLGRMPGGRRPGRVRRGQARRFEESGTGSGCDERGPHRDDLEFMLGGRAVKSYCSQGEQRAVALAFKFAQAAYMEKETGESPLFYWTTFCRNWMNRAGRAWWSL